FAQLREMFDEAKAVKSLGGRPLSVVTATVGEQRGWPAAQQRLARLSTNSGHETVARATHETLLADKGFAWIAGRAIVGVVERSGSGGPCPDARLFPTSP